MHPSISTLIYFRIFVVVWRKLLSTTVFKKQDISTPFKLGASVKFFLKKAWFGSAHCSLCFLQLTVTGYICVSKSETVWCLLMPVNLSLSSQRSSGIQIPLKSCHNSTTRNLCFNCLRYMENSSSRKKLAMLYKELEYIWNQSISEMAWEIFCCDSYSIQNRYVYFLNTYSTFHLHNCFADIN